MVDSFQCSCSLHFTGTSFFETLLGSYSLIFLGQGQSSSSLSSGFFQVGFWLKRMCGDNRSTYMFFGSNGRNLSEKQLNFQMLVSDYSVMMNLWVLFNYISIACAGVDFGQLSRFLKENYEYALVCLGEFWMCFSLFRWILSPL